ncbi:hypothetical protein CHS0354_019117 [Potamilus streckersoni]|uniref:Sugar phosphate transporter domain-containing protein n=1 Tax=Potamilus streckersoni TaxID=2493646 RepID=A0AAE0W5M3_9BIVA|nr:hypothetical protein CHS0354_019117 [Potamilus streckersoni]
MRNILNVNSEFPRYWKHRRKDQSILGMVQGSGCCCKVCEASYLCYTRGMEKRRILILSLTYCALFVATHFVNKYVLSVLKFQYPTIFQGWQTLVGFLMLSLLVQTKHLPPLLEDNTRTEIALWLPGMIFFVLSIYSGSRALSKLPIPVFLSLHNLVIVISCTANLVLNRKLTSVFSYAMLMILIITSVAIGKSDPLFVMDGYVWMCVHVLSTGALGIYSKLMRGRLKLDSSDRLYCNYLYSVIVLTPFSYLSGDALEAVNYPYLYFSEFYMGCIMSGVFGVFLSINFIRLQESDMDSSYISTITGAAKIITSLLSLLFFDIQLTGSHSFWLLINHLAAVVCKDSSGLIDVRHRGGLVHLTKQNAHTKEYIRVPASS